MESRKRTIYAGHLPGQPRVAGGSLLGPAQSAVLLPIIEVLLLWGVSLSPSLGWLSQWYRLSAWVEAVLDIPPRKEYAGEWQSWCSPWRRGRSPGTYHSSRCWSVGVMRALGLSAWPGACWSVGVMTALGLSAWPGGAWILLCCASISPFCFLPPLTTRTPLPGIPAPGMLIIPGSCTILFPGERPGKPIAQGHWDAAPEREDSWCICPLGCSTGRGVYWCRGVPSTHGAPHPGTNDLSGHVMALGHLPCASALGHLTQSCATPWSFHLPGGASALSSQLPWLC